jgi:hypothetical protein
MGDGGTDLDAGQVVGRSGDGGIDGVIKEDKLGLDMIYVQAKKWEATVGAACRPEFRGQPSGLPSPKRRIHHQCRVQRRSSRVRRADRDAGSAD